MNRTSTVSLVDKILSVFLGVILIGSVGATGSLYSTQIESNQAQTISSGPTLFPTLKLANAAPNGNKNCEMEAMKSSKIDEIFGENSTLLEDHPLFNFNRTDDMLEVKKMGPNNNPGMVHPHSPFGKLVQEKQKDNQGNN